MSFRLKAASLAAISLSALAALWASDTSLAGESASNLIGAATTLTPTTVTAPQLISDANVAFAPSREIVQPLTQQHSLSVEDSAQSAHSLNDLVQSNASEAPLDEETRCLATAVYFESKGESLAGQLAVARVVINRARSGRFANSLCGVVLQPSQFSFVRRGAMPAANAGSRDWREAVAISRIAMDNSWTNPAEGALYFHARRVSPAWKRQQIAAIDNHIFYR